MGWWESNFGGQSESQVKGWNSSAPSLTPSAPSGAGYQNQPSLIPTSSGNSGGGSGLTGYAALYKSAINQGMSDAQANQYATANNRNASGQNIGTGLTPSYMQQASYGSLIPTNYSVGQNGYVQNQYSSLIPEIPKIPEKPLIPPVPQYMRDAYTPVPAPYPSLKLSSGPETIIPTMDYVNKQYGLQNDMAKRIYDQNMYDYNMKQYERQKMADEAKRINDEAQLEIDRKKADAAMITANRPYSTGASGGLTRPTQTDRRNEATASAFQWVNELANSGRGMQTALKLFRDNIAEFTKDGADIGAVENFIYQVFTGQDKSKDNPIYLINSPSFGD